jgi:serine phosphatase RsbU (regulator of sigma subunit)
VLWVFVSVVVIEAIILIPSYMRRERELLTQLREVCSAKIGVLTQTTGPEVSGKKLFNDIRQLQLDPNLLGGVLYGSDGKSIGTFGERPELSFAEVNSAGVVDRQTKDGSRYDSAWLAPQLPGNYTLILRQDASPVKRELLAFILRIAGLVMIISFVVTVGAWLALGPIVVTPILRLRDDLVSAGEAISKDQDTPEFYSASVQREDELGEVIGAFRHMYHQITDAISERKKAEAALQKSFRQVEAYSQALNTELERGREMQKNFLPSQLLHKPGWEFVAYFKPAHQVAGDFYDAFELPGGYVGLVIADVCDKGVGAALFMALFRSLIRIFSGQTSLEGWDFAGNQLAANPQVPASENPGTNASHFKALKAVQLTNNYVAQNHGDLGMFATLFFGVLEPSTGLLTYISGGHEPLLIISPSGGVRENLSPTGPSVGMEADTKFEIKQIHIEPGEMLLGYTDGVLEASTASGEFFTRERLFSILEPAAGSATTLLDSITGSVLDHMGEADQHDDITLLAVRREPLTEDDGNG